MELLINTCLESYLTAIIKDKKVIKYIYREKLQHKSDALDKDVRILLKNAGYNASNIDAIYVTNGPGSFMGIRAGLIYCYTLAVMLDVPFLVASSLDFLSGGQPKLCYIDAKGGKSFFKDFPNGKEEVIDYQPNTEFDFTDFVSHPQNYLDLFKECTEPLANYMKEPKVN